MDVKASEPAVLDPVPPVPSLAPDSSGSTGALSPLTTALQTATPVDGATESSGKPDQVKVSEKTVTDTESESTATTTVPSKVRNS